MKKKIGKRIAEVIFNCTHCDGSSLTEEAFERHQCYLDCRPKRNLNENGRKT